MPTLTQALLHRKHLERLARLGARPKEHAPRPAPSRQEPVPSRPPDVGPVPPLVPKNANMSRTSCEFTRAPAKVRAVHIREETQFPEMVVRHVTLTKSGRLAARRLRKNLMLFLLELKLEVLLEEVAAEFEGYVTVERLKSPYRYGQLPSARAVFYYRAVTETDASYQQIGHAVGGVDHTSVMYGVAAYCKRQGLPMPRHINGGRLYVRAMKVGNGRWPRAGQAPMAEAPPCSAPQASVPAPEGREGYPHLANVAGQACRANVEGPETTGGSQ